MINSDLEAGCISNGDGGRFVKKAIPYAATAILLGIVTMLAPGMLLKSSYYGPLTSGGGETDFRYCSKESKTLDRGEALGRVFYPANLSSIGIMLIPSFLIALGVSLYLKKRMF